MNQTPCAAEDDRNRIFLASTSQELGLQVQRRTEKGLNTIQNKCGSKETLKRLSKGKRSSMAVPLCNAGHMLLAKTGSGAQVNGQVQQDGHQHPQEFIKKMPLFVAHPPLVRQLLFFLQQLLVESNWVPARHDVISVPYSLFTTRVRVVFTWPVYCTAPAEVLVWQIINYRSTSSLQLAPNLLLVTSSLRPALSHGRGPQQGPQGDKECQQVKALSQHHANLPKQTKFLRDMMGKCAASHYEQGQGAAHGVQGQATASGSSHLSLEVLNLCNTTVCVMFVALGILKLGRCHLLFYPSPADAPRTICIFTRPEGGRYRGATEPLTRSSARSSRPAPSQPLTVPVHRVALSLSDVHLVEASAHAHRLDGHQLLHLGLGPRCPRAEAAGAVLVVFLPGAGGRATHRVSIAALRPGTGARGLQQGPEGELDAQRVVAYEGLPGLLVLLVEPANLLRAQLRHYLVAVPGCGVAGPGALPVPGAPSRRPAAPRVRGDQRRRRRRRAAAARALALAVVAQRRARLGRAEVVVLVAEARVQGKVGQVVGARRQVQRLGVQQRQRHPVSRLVLEAAAAAAERVRRVRAQLPGAAAAAVTLGAPRGAAARVVHAAGASATRASDAAALSARTL
ncbi:hypothetical protein U0070_024724 [Myodes glareolus]|uniref:Uncharacterized protein n=1 Tax=Myodes glareolus TaxID=447135 RepID=A0AAW0HWJ4_MYOGA